MVFYKIAKDFCIFKDSYYMSEIWLSMIFLVKNRQETEDFQIDVVCWEEWLFARFNANLDFAVPGLEWCQI